MYNRLDLRRATINKEAYCLKFNLLTNLCRNILRFTLLN